MDLQGILKREFKSVWDLGKIPWLRKAFSNNFQQVKRAPDMVRDFYSQARKIILEIYHAFADEEEQKEIEGELNEGDDTSKEKDKNEGKKGKEKEEGSGEEGDKSPTDENQPKKCESHHKQLECPVRSCTPHAGGSKNF